MTTVSQNRLTTGDYPIDSSSGCHYGTTGGYYVGDCPYPYIPPYWNPPVHIHYPPTYIQYPVVFYPNNELQFVELQKEVKELKEEIRKLRKELAKK